MFVTFIYVNLVLYLPILLGLTFIPVCGDRSTELRGKVNIIVFHPSPKRTTEGNLARQTLMIMESPRLINHNTSYRHIGKV